MNRVLPGIWFETYESGDYSSADELVEDLDEAWEEYRERNGLERFGVLRDEFEVSTKGGFLRDEKVSLASDDYKAVFGEDVRSLRERLGDEDPYEPWNAKVYSTEHFSGEGSIDTMVRNRFIDEFLVDNFRLAESSIQDITGFETARGK